MKIATQTACKSYRLAKSRKLRENPFKNELFRLLEQKQGVSLAVLTVPYEGVRSRLLAAGTESLQRLFEQISDHLQGFLAKEQVSALSLAPQVVALDESSLD